MHCPMCHAGNLDDAPWCTQCFAALGDASAEAAPAVDIPDPDDSPAFRRTASVSLVPLPGGDLVFMEPGGGPQAHVVKEHIQHGFAHDAKAVLTGESGHHLNDRYLVCDVEGVPLFV